MSQQGSVYRRPQGVCETIVEWCFVLIGFALKTAVTIASLVVRGAAKLLLVSCRFLFAFGMKAAKRRVPKDLEATEPAKTKSPEPVPSLKPAMSVAEPKSRIAFSGPVTAAFTRTISFEKGFGSVLLWFYPGGKVRRLVKIYDRALIEQVGFERYELEEVAYSGQAEVEVVIRQTIAQVQRLLRGKHEVKLRIVASGSNESASDAKKEEGGSTKVQVEDTQVASTMEAKKVDGDVAVMPKSFKDAVELKRSKSRPAKVYTGRVIELGVKSRKISQEKGKPAKQIDQFCVTMEADELQGNALPVWGTDLERAIDECGAKVGDRVRIEHLGRIEWHEQNGKKAWKNAFNVELLS
ncbi:hypothetical protein PQH03_27715 [Ralstonia insidiosa]|jgi:hypothetical protein|uniref:Uncharacterized protein n=1 Tax=Ralstonia insidiosa TaxID=190721 RepID=A0A192A7H6_9RALS|nr:MULTISPECIES: hypothetical protein [Ralstonia]KMW44799.1 hypothetical protein AC240_22825 [Ralstonia sp. MD27]ANJ76339.1 hypothetical protein A9Y76_27435 [Ralstonia insidiosa]MBA9869810.1 hypothetical protein [Ralstonia insidiosa]MBA9913482.1 hypothetical protein [Ralstonia insidiosa]MBA9952806.1 hypothetical protein [Ralstonia insidiosa]